MQAQEIVEVARQMRAVVAAVPPQTVVERALARGVVGLNAC